MNLSKSVKAPKAEQRTVLIWAQDCQGCQIIEVLYQGSPFVNILSVETRVLLITMLSLTVLLSWSWVEEANFAIHQFHFKVELKINIKKKSRFLIQKWSVLYLLSNLFWSSLSVSNLRFKMHCGKYINLIWKVDFSHLCIHDCDVSLMI